ncbi:MAG: SDR family oxidoreductase [Anaerolineae bacterium]
MSFYLVTGGAGFIGSSIVEELLLRRQRVRVLDNFATGQRANLTPFLDQIEMIEGDIRDLETVRDAVSGVDFVLHQAALPSVPRSVAAPITTNETNITGTLNILVAARDAQVRRVVYASSSSVYGNSPTLPKHENMPTAPMSPYAVSKLAGENYCQAFTTVYNLPTIALRYFNVFGPRQNPTSQYSAVIPKFISQMLAGKSPTINGDGSQSRDFTFVKNVVRANLLAAEAPPQISGFYNVACGVRYTLMDLVDKLNEILGLNVKPQFGPERPGDVKHSLADITKIQQALGYEPQIDFVEGLKLIAQTFLSDASH